MSTKFKTLTKEQLNERSSNKLEAMLFFAHKRLQKYELQLEGVIPTKMDVEATRGLVKSQEQEIEVLNNIFDLIEKSY